jgi:hypothetical protein
MENGALAALLPFHHEPSHQRQPGFCGASSILARFEAEQRVVRGCGAAFDP